MILGTHAESPAWDPHHVGKGVDLRAGRKMQVSALDAVMNLNPEPGLACSVYVPCNRGQGNATKGREGTTKG